MMRGCKHLLPLLLCLAACRRDPGLDAAAPAGADYGQGTGRCRLSGVVETLLADTGRHSIKELHYDAQGRLLYVFNRQYFTPRPATYGFTYRGDTIIINHLLNTSLDDTVAIDPAGLPVHIFGFFSTGPGAQQTSNRLIYNAHQVLTGSVGNSFGFPGYDRAFSWAGGDLQVDSEMNARVYRYAYYADKPAQHANPLTLQEFLFFGRPVVQKSAQLPRYRSYSDYPAYSLVYRDTFSYAFDAEGKIIADTVRGASGDSYAAFSYDCR